MTEKDAMNARGHYLLRDPVIRAHSSRILAKDRERHDDCRRSMAGTRRAGIDKASHKVAEFLHVERAVLHLVVDIVRLRSGHFLAFLVAAATACVINRLA